jgi:hypothetical protein
LFAYPIDWLKQMIPWLGVYLYNISDEIIARMSGSGDALFDYLVILTVFLIAIIGTIIWSLFDRKRNDYAKIYYWFTVAIQYYVGVMLISYGMVNVIQLQFAYPGLYRMLGTYLVSFHQWD